MKPPYFFQDKPLFGIDIGRDSVRVMQAHVKDGRPTIKGYGSAAFSSASTKNGVITDPVAVATAIRSILDSGVIGSINTERVAMSLPSARTFSRAIGLPKLKNDELADAVGLEIEQYIPTATDNYYVDFSVINETSEGMEVMVVAVPKIIADSYLAVADQAGLEVILIETSLDAADRLFALTNFGTIPSVIIKHEQGGIDISIVDKHIITTGTIDDTGVPVQIAAGPKTVNPNATSAAASSPSSTPVSASQAEVLIGEIRRMVRYYNERYDQTHKIEQIVFIGNQPELSKLAATMTDQLRLPTRLSDPWQLFTYESHVPRVPVEKSDDFITVAGLSLAHPRKVFK